MLFWCFLVSSLLEEHQTSLDPLSSFSLECSDYDGVAVC